MIGRPLAYSSSACTPRKNSVTYCSFTSSPSSPRVSVLMTSDVPFGRCSTATGVARDETHPGLERPMEQHVLLVVHHEAANVAGGDGLGRGRDHVPYRHDHEDRPSETSSVASAYACMAVSVTSYPCPLPARPIAPRSKLAMLVSGIAFQAT